MLRIHVIVPFLLLICSALASEVISSPNQIEADSPSEDATEEGRACGGCGGGTPGPKPHPEKPDIHDLIHELLPSHHELLVWVMTKIPVLVFHILGLVLLDLLLKKLLSDDTGPAATGYAPTSYASPSSSYADPLFYNRRASSWSLQNLKDSPAVTYLTKVVTNAIDKYNFIEEH